MKSKELREKFLSYFEKYNHDRIASSSLVPHDDPTLLFANAGMNQFKDYFTGKAIPKNKRATTSQKCVRAGGKHNDLESVGKTARHHTFFEMLGNFSFGDYFKSEAIDFAWKFLTEELKLPKERLYITVHESDDEAKAIWIKEQNIPENRIFKMGDKDNFWEMGDVGPCGPCSEIFYDHGEQYSGGNYNILLEDEDRYIEIWNLVFMQFEKHLDGTRTNLPAPSVDTGAGLERLAAVLQGVYWNYDTDLFQPIIKEIERLSNKSYSDYRVPMQVIADHIRSTTMLISDGVIPSNEGRGYVLRRIIRRGVRFANELGLKKITLFKLAPIVFEILGENYMDNAANISLVEKTLKQEEEKFRSTLDQGIKILDQFIEENNGKSITGEQAFKLYDTYGFPIDLTRTILEEKKLKLDESGFKASMEKQVERSKQGQKFQVQEDNLKFFYDLKDKYGATQFTGYEQTNENSELLALDKIDNKYFALFSSTPFYAESGGQIGDIGTIGSFEVIDTQKPVDDLIIHIFRDKPNLKVGDNYNLCVNEVRRELIKKNHSATHMLQATLAKVLGSHVNQAGSLVTEDKLRFDFTHDQKVTIEQIKKIENIVNENIENNLKVSSQNMLKDDAIKVGAKALFGEKYGEHVRVINMAGSERAFSTELCGGIHVDNTSEIEYFKITSESSLAIGIRRIEAITSYQSVNSYLQDSLKELNEKFKSETHSFQKRVEQSVAELGQDITKDLSENINNLKRSLKNDLEKISSKFSSNDISRKITELEKRISDIESKKSTRRDKEKMILKLKEQIADKKRSGQAADLFNNGEDLGAFHFFGVKVEMQPKDLRKLSDNFVDTNSKDVLFLYTKSEDKVSFILRAHRESSFNFSKMTKDLMNKYEGRGGGKPDMTQGSFPEKYLTHILQDLKQGLI